jgi:hypothetical protein
VKNRAKILPWRKILPKVYEVVAAIGALYLCGTGRELAQAFQKVCRSIGMDLLTYQVIADLPFQYVVSDLPMTDGDHRALRSCMSSIVLEARTLQRPFLWGPACLCNGRSQLTAYLCLENSPLGGIAVPILGEVPSLRLLCLASRKLTAPRLEWLNKNIAVMQLAALTFYAHYEVLFKSGRERLLSQSLTQRERECLTWVAAGKSSWEISRIMAISERTVNFHIGNTKRKPLASRLHRGFPRSHSEPASEIDMTDSVTKFAIPRSLDVARAAEPAVGNTRRPRR